MGRKVDLDDVVDAAGVAEIIGLGRASHVSTYRNRYDNFPTPVLDLGAGRCPMWLRSEVVAWDEQRRKHRRSTP